MSVWFFLTFVVVVVVFGRPDARRKPESAETEVCASTGVARSLDSVVSVSQQRWKRDKH